ncbi:hypothetical protein F5878DRAFT_448139 [Lentinula raphanica]|uniref:Uncharacterized protein n=1 Tax=Lentinula raphanica TaxID=153919 RepID=A0AA38NY49_9AGAR|nr:hypothetical protein F5878DRAFT_448139 [Lentinula raphanica]
MCRTPGVGMRAPPLNVYHLHEPVRYGLRLLASLSSLHLLYTSTSCHVTYQLHEFSQLCANVSRANLGIELPPIIPPQLTSTLTTSPRLSLQNISRKPSLARPPVNRLVLKPCFDLHSHRSINRGSLASSDAIAAGPVWNTGLVNSLHLNVPPYLPLISIPITSTPSVPSPSTQYIHFFVVPIRQMLLLRRVDVTVRSFKQVYLSTKSQS